MKRENEQFVLKVLRVILTVPLVIGAFNRGGRVVNQETLDSSENWSKNTLRQPHKPEWLERKTDDTTSKSPLPTPTLNYFCAPQDRDCGGYCGKCPELDH